MKPLTEAEATALALSLGAEITIDGRTFNSERSTIARRKSKPPAEAPAAPVETQPASAEPPIDKVAAAIENLGLLMRQTLTDLAAIMSSNPVIVAPPTPGPTPAYEVKRNNDGVPVALIRTRAGFPPEEIKLQFNERMPSWQ